MADEKTTETPAVTFKHNGKEYTPDQLVGFVAELAAGNQKFAEALQAGREEIAQLRQIAEQRPAAASQDVQPQGPDTSNLTQADLELKEIAVREAEAKLQAKFDEKMEAMTEELAALKNDTTRSGLAAELDKIRSQDPSIDEFGPEMTALKKEHPDLPLARLYAIAKAENADKVKDIETRKAEEEAKENPKEDDFLGLFPTSKRGIETEKLDEGAAADKAWETVGADRILS